MEATLLSLALFLIGAWFTFRNVRMLYREDLLREYVQTNPKAALWVRKHGVEGATKLTRKVFLPLGTVVSFGMTLYGAWLLWRIHG